MSLLAPIWLLLLIPWGGLVAWSLLGRPRLESATAVFLWKQGPVDQSTSRSLRRPALWLICLLASLLMAIAALSTPATIGRANVSVRIDDRPGLAATIEGSTSRADATLRELRTWAIERGIGLVDEATEHSVEALITDDSSQQPTPRRVPVLPRDAVANAGVARISYASGEVMLRIVNRRATPIDHVTIATDGNSPRQVSIEPIAPDSSADRFVRLSGPSLLVAISLPADDGYPADDVARLARVAGGASVVVGADVPTAIGRLASAYTSARGEGLRPVLLTRDGTFAGDSVLIARASSDNAGPVTSVPHELLSGVRLPERLSASVDPLPTSGWTIIARAGDAPIIAVREVPSRQVWLALPFDDASFAQSVDFAVLLTNAIDFVAGSRGVSMTAVEATARRGPGVYDDEGIRVAVNQPYVNTGVIRVDASWRDALAERVDASRERRPFGNVLYGVAALLAGLAIFLR